MSGAETVSKKRQTRVCLFFNEKIEKNYKNTCNGGKSVLYYLSLQKYADKSTHTYGAERRSVPQG